jgi:hypothetical protein
VAYHGFFGDERQAARGKVYVDEQETSHLASGKLVSSGTSLFCFFCGERLALRRWHGCCPLTEVGKWQLALVLFARMKARSAKWRGNRDFVHFSSTAVGFYYLYCSPLMQWQAFFSIGKWSIGFLYAF